MMGLNGIAVFFYGYNGVNNKICNDGGYHMNKWSLAIVMLVLKHSIFQMQHFNCWVFVAFSHRIACDDDY